MSSSRSIYEYMGNKKWLQTARQEQNGQGLLACVEPVQALDLDERYTTRETLEWCKAKAGVRRFDLDVAACEESKKAPHWYGAAQDGLKLRWWGRTWCNPPYSDIEPWVTKAWAEITRGGGPDVIAMLLPATRTEQAWWQNLVEPFRGSGGFEIYFLPGRQRFGIPGNPEGKGVGSPPFGVVLLVWSR